MNNSLFSHFMPYCVEVEQSDNVNFVTLKNRGYETIFKVKTSLQITRRALGSIGVQVDDLQGGALRSYLYSSHPEYGETDFDKSERFVEYYIRLTKLLRILHSVTPDGVFTINCQQ